MRRNSGHADRAKQFMPFDALKGFREALAEQERVVVPQMELTEDRLEELDRKLRCVQQNDVITVVYFCKDEYRRATGMVSHIDAQSRTLTIVKTRIRFCDVFDIGGDGVCEDAP